MSEDQPHRQHRSRRSSSKSRGTRSGAVSARPTWFGLALKAGIAVIVSLVAIIFIVRHFSSDIIATAAVDPTWTSDGIAAELGGAAAALQSTPPALGEALTDARQALSESPLSTAALDLLAQAAQASGDRAAADRYRALILERTLRNFPTLRWKYDEALRRRDFATMMQIADAILRQDFVQGDSRYIFGTMAAVAGDPEAQPHLIAILQTSSAWRRTFLDMLARVGPVDAFPDIMASVPRNPSVPPVAFLSNTWNIFFDRLSKRGDSRSAYVIWTSLLPPDELTRLGLLYNGDFESNPTGTMFDWTLTRAKGLEMVLDNVNPGEGTNSLRISFSGVPMNFQNVAQTLILDPGTYTLGGMVRMDNLQNARGLTWRILCQSRAGLRTLAASTPFAGTSDWSQFSFDFTVPPTGCDYQMLRLDLPARIEAERDIKGRIWFDGMSIASKVAADAAAVPAAGG